MKRVPISEERAFELITNGGGVIMREYLHDNDCPTLGTGNGFDCACEPDVRHFEYIDEPDTLGAGGIY